MAGHYSKAGVEAGAELREFRVDEKAVGDLKVGAELKVDIFTPGMKVDVSGTTIGKGHAGVIKRHHFSSNRASHGNSLSHNKPGSIGMAQDPGRVFRKAHVRPPGQRERTVQLLEIARVDAERSLLMVAARVPAARTARSSCCPA
jgi:large subunit ribosomal protein L3